jgi:hypothetical protein
MDINKVLSCLDQVRGTGPDKWIACCPAHDDKTPSLTIKDTGDRILMHCFVGCHISDIVAAIGLGLHDLFADSKATSQIAPSVSRRQLFDALEIELLILAQCAHKRAQDEAFSGHDTERELIAWKRVDAARRATR